MIEKIIIILYILLFIKCQKWYEEVNGYNISDKSKDSKEYLGKYYVALTDFYLCSERKYRVHFLDDNWSPEYTACQPVGNCEQFIDGIAISGGLQYISRYEDQDNFTEEAITKYDINNKIDGYSGELGNRTILIAIEGNESYSGGYYFKPCSCEKKIANFIFNDLFEDYDEPNMNYKEEISINKDNQNKIYFTAQLINTSEINFKGNIIIKIKNGEVNNSKIDNFEQFIGKNLKIILEKAININFDNLKEKLEKMVYKHINHGNIAINFNWNKKIITIDVGIKILPDFYIYRGGFRINIYLDDENIELLNNIKIILKIFFKYYGQKSLSSITKLLSEINSFEKIETIMNKLDIYSNIIEEIILLVILSPYINKD